MSTLEGKLRSLISSHSYAIALAEAKSKANCDRRVLALCGYLLIYIYIYVYMCLLLYTHINISICIDTYVFLFGLTRPGPPPFGLKPLCVFSVLVRTPGSMGVREIGADPAPLVPVFSKTLKHKCIKYHKSLKNGEKVQKKKIEVHRRLMRGLYKVQKNLCFRKTTVQAALFLAVPALNKVFNTPLKKHQETPWTVSVSRRVASMCRHTSQVLVKSKGTSSWAHQMLAGASSEEEEDEDDGGGEDLSDEEQEEEEEEDEEAADAEMPTGKADTYKVGFCRQARKAWRLHASGGKKKESGLR